MAQFAKIGTDNIVEKVHTIRDDLASTEQAGADYLNKTHKINAVWKQSFTDGTRKNPAHIGATYDESRDAFISPKPYPSWTLNETTCTWDPPVPFPEDPDKFHEWNEAGQNWVEIFLF